MGDENTLLTEAAARHLLRRTGFGAPRAEIQRMLDRGLTRGTAADELLSFRAKAFKPGGSDFQTAHNKWIKQLVKTKFPIQEKLVLFWHDHFATGASKLVMTLGDRTAAKIISRQIQLLHKSCKGNMRTLVKAINKDTAMMEFLDTVRNFADIPNENYARELQELFTLGVLDAAGNPNYAQADIVQIARAFTGWGYDSSLKASLQPQHHDFSANFPSRGPKRIFASTGQFGPGGRDFTVNGEGVAEIDTVVDIIFEHRDSDLQNTVARRTARRLIEYLAHPDPSQSFVDDVVAQSGFDGSFEIAPLLRAILVHDDFYLSGLPVPWGSAVKTSVKWPIDYFVSTLRLLQMKLEGAQQFVPGANSTPALSHLTDMGQTILDPPSVFGWDWETNWLSSATLLARCTFAVDVSTARGTNKTAFRPEAVFDLSLTAPSAIVDEGADILGIRDHLSSAEHGVFEDYLTENGINPTLDLNDPDVRSWKLRGLFALLLQCPAYQMH